MSKGARWAVAIVLVALGTVLIGAVGTVPGAVVILVGVLFIPWFPGMGA